MLGTSVNCTSIDREPNNVGLIFYVSKCFFRRLKVFFYVKITEFSGNGRDVFFWPLSLYLRQNSLSFKASKGRVEGGYKDETLCP